jgi:hypothetical protein
VVVEAEVTVGSPDAYLMRNAQNEPSVAIDPIHPNVLVAGANDSIDNAVCAGTACTFEIGVGTAGVYISLDGGASWTQPEYTGWSARTGTPEFGPIGTLPWYYESGLDLCCDPALAFGPRPGPGGFSWANGSRLYYLAPAFAFGDPRETSVKGVGAMFVSRTDDPATAALGGAVGKAAWFPPVLISSKQSKRTMHDKPGIGVDDAATSPYFGNVYACWTALQANTGGKSPIVVSRSSDGGASWSAPRAVTASSGSSSAERQGCQVRADSHGTVYVVFFQILNGKAAQFVARSFDGGRSFEKPRRLASVVEVGKYDALGDWVFFEGARGSRTNSYPMLDIANGAPTGVGATDAIAVTWSDARNGLNHEEALFILSTDRGATWSSPIDVAETGDRPDFPTVALSPDGLDAYVVYDGFLDPWREDFSEPRRVQGVVRHSSLSAGGFTSWTTLHRGAVGDTRGLRHPQLRATMFGDYNGIDATNDAVVGVWNDAREVAVCEAMNTYYEFLLMGVSVLPPALEDCPVGWGNSDIWSAAIVDPTP